MTLNYKIDLKSGVVTPLNLPAPVTAITMRRNQRASLRLFPTEYGVPVNLPGGYTIAGAVKKSPDAENAVAFSEWSGASPVVAELYAGGDVLDELLASDNDASNDVLEAPLLCDFIVLDGSGNLVCASQSIAFTVRNGVTNGDETGPEGAELSARLIESLSAVTGLVGGTSAHLDSRATVNLPAGWRVVVNDGGTLRFFILKAGTLTTSAPNRVRGADYNGSTNAKYWLQETPPVTDLTPAMTAAATAQSAAEAAQSTATGAATAAGTAQSAATAAGSAAATAQSAATAAGTAAATAQGTATAAGAAAAAAQSAAGSAQTSANDAQADVDAHVSNSSNPHGVTKTQVGLGNVDNTTDAAKPVSTATSTALGLKVDKVGGKGLSTEDYSSAEKTKLAGLSAPVMASQAEAEAGTDNTKLTTPLRVAQAIAALAGGGGINLASTSRDLAKSDVGKIVQINNFTLTLNVPPVGTGGGQVPWVVGDTIRLLAGNVFNSYGFTLTLGAAVEAHTSRWQNNYGPAILGPYSFANMDAVTLIYQGSNVWYMEVPPFKLEAPLTRSASGLLTLTTTPTNDSASALVISQPGVWNITGAFQLEAFLATFSATRQISVLIWDSINSSALHSNSAYTGIMTTERKLIGTLPFSLSVSIGAGVSVSLMGQGSINTVPSAGTAYMRSLSWVAQRISDKP